MLLGALGVLALGVPGGAAAAGAAPKATLQQCVTDASQSERSATFAGEMTALPASTRMDIRIDVLERMPSEDSYHMVIAPGLGVWRSSAPGVKVFKYIKQITNLSAPAFYRGVVRFRWRGSHGRTIATAQLRTRRCEQLLAPATEEATPAPVGAG